jgi:hypothetical protein
MVDLTDLSERLDIITRLVCKGRLGYAAFELGMLDMIMQKTMESIPDED